MEDKSVNLYLHRRNPFYKLGWNENHIENQRNYEKKRKEKLDQWENPPYSWPPFLPRPTMHTGKTLLGEVEREYKEKIRTSRPFKVPNSRSGDVVDVTLFRSLSEGKFHKFRGVVLGKKNPNSLNKSLKIVCHEADEKFGMMVKEYSPMVAKIDIHKFGSNQLRKNMTNLHEADFSKNRCYEPIIKGRNYKVRDKKVDIGKGSNLEKERGKGKRESSKLEAAYKD